MDRRRFLTLGSLGVLAAAGAVGGRALTRPTNDRLTGALPRPDLGQRAPAGTDPEPGAPLRRDLPDARADDNGAASDGPTEPHSPPAEPDDPGDAEAADGEAADGEAADGEAAAAEQPELDPAHYTAAPREWGEHPTGVGRRLTGSEAIALTFDACGGGAGNGYDAALIDHLRRLEVPATLFLAGRWIEANPRVTAELAADPLFELANHGTQHLPLSISGRSAYGITGTDSVEAVIAEVQGAQAQLTQLTGQPPRWFRSGTAHYDEVAVTIVRDLGLEVAGYDVLGDAGATFTASQVRSAVAAARPGSVVLLHMNHPSSGTAEGVAAALTDLQQQGASFTTLGAHRLT